MPSDAGMLVPGPLEAPARPFKRLGVAFGVRFFVLLAIGLIWLGPALFETRFIYALVVWDILVAGAWLLDLWSVPGPSQMRLRRSWLTPPALSVPSDIRLTLFNESALTIRAGVLDNVPHQLGVEPTVLQLRVGPRGEAETQYRIVPRERGEVECGDVYIRYQGPLRIAERWARAPLAQTIVVYPNLDEARRESIYLVRSRQIELERRSRRLRGAGRAFESLREYRDGDELRDICWTATARRGKLVTRLYEIERSQTVWILIDSGRLMRTQVASVTKLDHAVNAALTLSQVALVSGDRVGLLTYGRRIGHRLPASRGGAHLRQILEHLAAVRADEWEADHVQAAGRLLSDQKRRSLVVWMTDVPDTAMTPEVVQAASRLMPRHLVLFLVIGQPDLTAVATRKPGSASDMFLTAAAQEVVHRRELLLARLRARGALALEVSAGWSPALVNAYLEIKQRNRL
jgi:uncharacterized protein (DUF58 family)